MVPTGTGGDKSPTAKGSDSKRLGIEGVRIATGSDGTPLGTGGDKSDNVARSSNGKDLDAGTPGETVPIGSGFRGLLIIGGVLGGPPCSGSGAQCRFRGPEAHLSGAPGFRQADGAETVIWHLAGIVDVMEARRVFGNELRLGTWLAAARTVRKGSLFRKISWLRLRMGCLLTMLPPNEGTTAAVLGP